MVMGFNGEKPVRTAEEDYTPWFQNTVDFVEKPDIVRNMLINLSAYYYIKRGIPKGKIHRIA